MSEQQQSFTPGPWEKVGEHELSLYGHVADEEVVVSGSVVIANPEMDEMAIVVADMNFRNVWDDDLLDANVALICAAPKLFKALAELVATMDDEWMEGEEDDEPTGWCSDADGGNSRPTARTFGHIRRAKEALASAQARDTDGSPKGGDGEAGSMRSTTAGPEGIAQTPADSLK
jgi:hypothetical protein